MCVGVERGEKEEEKAKLYFSEKKKKQNNNQMTIWSHHSIHMRVGFHLS